MLQDQILIEGQGRSKTKLGFFSHNVLTLMYKKLANSEFGLQPHPVLLLLPDLAHFCGAPVWSNILNVPKSFINEGPVKLTA